MHAGVCVKQRHWINVLSTSGTCGSNIRFRLEVNSHFLFIAVSEVSESALSLKARG